MLNCRFLGWFRRRNPDSPQLREALGLRRWATRTVCQVRVDIRKDAISPRFRRTVFQGFLRSYAHQPVDLTDNHYFTTPQLKDIRAKAGISLYAFVLAERMVPGCVGMSANFLSPIPKQPFGSLISISRRTHAGSPPGSSVIRWRTVMLDANAAIMRWVGQQKHCWTMVGFSWSLHIILLLTTVKARRCSKRQTLSAIRALPRNAVWSWTAISATADHGRHSNWLFMDRRNHETPAKMNRTCGLEGEAKHAKHGEQTVYELRSAQMSQDSGAKPTA
ncbi:hypothetical protein BC835DRAFT_1306002 [Cytidiella melzeri]|nr:hypothetical protein BC835DRAFT_1306002 [Cytidiella melzeri]